MKQLDEETVSNGISRSATEFPGQQRNFPLSKGIFRYGECFLVKVTVATCLSHERRNNVFVSNFCATNLYKGSYFDEYFLRIWFARKSQKVVKIRIRKSAAMFLFFDKNF